jgi:hypothetical protein
MEYWEYCNFQERILERKRKLWSILILIVTALWPGLVPWAFILIYYILPSLLRHGWENYNGKYQTLKEQNFTFTATGIEHRLETETRETAWRNLYGFEETRNNILIYIGKYDCYCLPKHCIKNEAHLALLRQYLQAVPPYKDGPWLRRLCILFCVLASWPFVLILIW